MAIPSKTTCDIDRLRLLLADQLPERQQLEVADHISDCANCQRALESMAGDLGWWSEVESCLRTHAGNTTNGDDSAAGLRDSDELDESFTADFVVDFLEPSDQPNVLGRLGEYEILEIIGRGGMGVVLKGYQRELARFVAVKVMAPHLASSGAARQRFVREARAAAAIVHPYVMPIHSVCTTARLPYLVMPFVACESLQQRIDRQGPLEIIEILRIGLQASHGLAASHAQGLVHRDIKPANILLEKGVDRVMLTDFGLARAVDDASLTRTGIVTGTPQYMSPEQSCGEAIDARSDLFSLGSVLYAMCAGRPPFRAESALAVLRRITDSQARSLREINPQVPEWLEQIVLQLHAKSPDQRYQSADEVAKLLEQCLAHVQQPTAVALPASLRVKPRVATNQAPRRLSGKQWTMIGGAALLLIIALSAPRMWPGQAPTQHAAPTPGDVNLPKTPPIAAVPVSSSMWDTAVPELEQLQFDLQSFETTARRAWDIFPQPTSSLSDDIPDHAKDLP